MQPLRPPQHDRPVHPGRTVLTKVCRDASVLTVDLQFHHFALSNGFLLKGTHKEEETALAAQVAKQAVEECAIGTQFIGAHGALAGCNDAIF